LQILWQRGHFRSADSIENHLKHNPHYLLGIPFWQAGNFDAVLQNHNQSALTLHPALYE
jgi:hypothetical protein